MNKTEVAKLLTMASAIDNRTVGVETVEAWYMTLGDLDYTDASEAMFSHFKNSTDYLMPKQIRDGVEAINRRRERQRQQLIADFTVALRDGGDRATLIKDPKFLPLGIES